MRRFLLLALPILIVFAWPSFRTANAQAPSPYALLKSGVTSLTYTDTTCTNNTKCEYEITSTLGDLESGPSPSVVVAIPETGTHSVLLTWTAPTSGPAPASYNVYRVQGPAPPTGLAGAVN